MRFFILILKFLFLVIFGLVLGLIGICAIIFIVLLFIIIFLIWVISIISIRVAFFVLFCIAVVLRWVGIYLFFFHLGISMWCIAALFIILLRIFIILKVGFFEGFFLRLHFWGQFCTVMPSSAEFALVITKALLRLIGF